MGGQRGRRATDRDAGGLLAQFPRLSAIPCHACHQAGAARGRGAGETLSDWAGQPLGRACNAPAPRPCPMCLQGGPAGQEGQGAGSPRKQPRQTLLRSPDPAIQVRIGSWKPWHGVGSPVAAPRRASGGRAARLSSRCVSARITMRQIHGTPAPTPCASPCPIPPAACAQALLERMRCMEIVDPLASMGSGEGAAPGSVPSPEGLAAAATMLDEAAALEEQGLLFQKDRCASLARVWEAAAWDACWVVLGAPVLCHAGAARAQRLGCINKWLRLGHRLPAPWPRAALTHRSLSACLQRGRGCRRCPGRGGSRAGPGQRCRRV